MCNFCFIPLLFHELIYHWMFGTTFVYEILLPYILYSFLYFLDHAVQFIVWKVSAFWLGDKFWKLFFIQCLLLFLFNLLQLYLLVTHRGFNSVLSKFANVKPASARSCEANLCLQLHDFCPLSHEVTSRIMWFFHEGSVDQLIRRTTNCPSNVVTPTIEGWSHVWFIYLREFHILGTTIRFTNNDFSTLAPLNLLLSWH